MLQFWFAMTQRGSGRSLQEHSHGISGWNDFQLSPVWNLENKIITLYLPTVSEDFKKYIMDRRSTGSSDAQSCTYLDTAIMLKKETSFHKMNCQDINWMLSILCTHFPLAALSQHPNEYSPSFHPFDEDLLKHPLRFWHNGPSRNECSLFLQPSLKRQLIFRGMFHCWVFFLYCLSINLMRCLSWKVGH
jgi:hypothetical protein